ncbi:hypothetical protein ACA910_019878 [Epithemia clementina (nom. ined.)]
MEAIVQNLSFLSDSLTKPWDDDDDDDNESSTYDPSRRTGSATTGTRTTSSSRPTTNPSLLVIPARQRQRRRQLSSSSQTAGKIAILSRQEMFELVPYSKDEKQVEEEEGKKDWNHRNRHRRRPRRPPREEEEKDEAETKVADCQSYSTSCLASQRPTTTQIGRNGHFGNAGGAGPAAASLVPNNVPSRRSPAAALTATTATTMDRARSDASNSILVDDATSLFYEQLEEADSVASIFQTIARRRQKQGRNQQEQQENPLLRQQWQHRSDWDHHSTTNNSSRNSSTIMPPSPLTRSERRRRRSMDAMTLYYDDLKEQEQHYNNNDDDDKGFKADKPLTIRKHRSHEPNSSPAGMNPTKSLDGMRWRRQPQLNHSSMAMPDVALTCGPAASTPNNRHRHKFRNHHHHDHHQMIPTMRIGQRSSIDAMTICYDEFQHQQQQQQQQKQLAVRPIRSILKRSKEQSYGKVNYGNNGKSGRALWQPRRRHSMAAKPFVFDAGSNGNTAKHQAAAGARDSWESSRTSQAVSSSSSSSRKTSGRRDAVALHHDRYANAAPGKQDKDPILSREWTFDDKDSIRSTLTDDLLMNMYMYRRKNGDNKSSNKNNNDDKDIDNDIDNNLDNHPQTIPFIHVGTTCGSTYELVGMDEETFQVTWGRGWLDERHLPVEL